MKKQELESKVKDFIENGLGMDARIQETTKGIR